MNRKKERKRLTTLSTGCGWWRTVSKWTWGASEKDEDRFPFCVYSSKSLLSFPLMLVHDSLTKTFDRENRSCRSIKTAQIRLIILSVFAIEQTWIWESVQLFAAAASRIQMYTSLWNNIIPRRRLEHDVWNMERERDTFDWLLHY